MKQLSDIFYSLIVQTVSDDGDLLRSEIYLDGQKVKGLVDYTLEHPLGETPLLTLVLRVASINEEAVPENEF